MDDDTKICRVCDAELPLCEFLPSRRKPGQYTKTCKRCMDLESSHRLMLRRCTDPGYKGYYKYGGKAIFICDDFYDFETFRLWAIHSDSYKQIEFGNRAFLKLLPRAQSFAPGNCIWVTNRD
jgi:hypothetical protein